MITNVTILMEVMEIGVITDIIKIKGEVTKIGIRIGIQVCWMMKKMIFPV